MANTEIMATLQKVRLAKTAVGSARNSPGLSQGQSDTLDSAYVTLDEVENKLILQDIGQWIAVIEADGNRLTGLATQIQSAITSLQSVAHLVQGAATAIGALASIISKGVSSGLI
jgi:hypothetical protein